MQIYWIRDGRRCGPASVPDVEAMLQLGELSADTLGWHTGCDRWLPLRELPALADIMANEETADPNAPPPIAVELGEKLPPNLPPLLFDVILPGPMARFLARMVDMSLYATLVLGIMYFFKVPYMEYFQPGGLAFWVPLIMIEACIISRCSTTPGKWLLGIRMQFSHAKPVPVAAFLRSVLVFILGLGCMFPPITVFMLLFSYFNVRKRGIAIWDVHSTIVPMMATPPTAARKLAACVLIFFCLQLGSAFMQPWLPDMMEILRERDPAAARTIEEWLTPKS